MVQWTGLSTGYDRRMGTGRESFLSGFYKTVCSAGSVPVCFVSPTRMGGVGIQTHEAVVHSKGYRVFGRYPDDRSTKHRSCTSSGRTYG